MTTTEGSLKEEIRRLTPALEAVDAEARELRMLPHATWQALHECGVLRMLQPARLGGGEAPLPEFLRAVMDLSAASPSAGWVAGVIGVHPWQLALFDSRAQEEMWADDPARMHSSSYNPTGKATPVDGGYEVSGRWSFSSGCDHCEGVNLGALIFEDAARRPDYRSFLLHRDQYRIEDNWHVAGLQGTGSKDIVVEKAFVPDYRSQSHVDYAFGNALPGWEVNTGPLYRLPWSVVFTMALAAPVFGAARGFVDRWIEESASRKLFGGQDRLRDDPLTQRRLAEATWTLDAAVVRMQTDADELTRIAEAGDLPTMQQRGQLRWNVTRGCELVGDAITELFRSASGRSIYLDHPLQGRFQDIQGALGHGFLASDPLAKAAGGFLMGTSRREFVL
jgi:3-hydroxy-9,10-secoandrosta-1,3,5(10)-triene-9,17-dione monooxygenase